MRPRNLSILALLLAALAIAGCGGGSSDSTTTPTTTEATTTLTKEELIARGDSICAEVNAAVGTVGENTEEGASQVGQVADLYIGMVESLKGIGTPDDTAGYSEFISTGEELAQAESDAKLADERADSEALSEAETRSTTALASFQSAAVSYGFKECGQEAIAPTPAESSESSESEGSEVEEAVEPEAEAAPEEVEEAAPETGGGAGTEAPPAGESSGGSSSGGVGPG